MACTQFRTVYTFGVVGVSWELRPVTVHIFHDSQCGWMLSCLFGVHLVMDQANVRLVCMYPVTWASLFKERNLNVDYLVQMSPKGFKPCSLPELRPKMSYMTQFSKRFMILRTAPSSYYGYFE